ncbi:MAG TPA: hypothetical protein VGW75_18255 [Solirubrobacteraceae bacterium]|jgi:hypothetical protein|nr:hypothetical protein [Solirubrobacteraceae bacterium]
MSSTPPPGQPSEEELRAAYEAEIKKLRVEDVVIQTVVSLVNLGGRKAGLAPGTEDERDLGQLRTAIEATRALLPLVEGELGPDAAQVRNALSQLQMAYAQGAQGTQGTPAGGEGGEAAQEAPTEGRQEPGGPGPAQSSGRLWVPGQ